MCAWMPACREASTAGEGNRGSYVTQPDLDPFNQTRPCTVPPTARKCDAKSLGRLSLRPNDFDT